MCKDVQASRPCKGVYRVRNWSEYNAGLIARGDVTVWIEESVWASSIPHRQSGRGRPRVYPERIIQMLLTVKQVYRLTLRSLQGFAQSLKRLAFKTLCVPDYTTLCRRSHTLEVHLPILRSGEALHILVDSTGVKLYGEGEWKVRQHGYSKRRTWRKLHLAMDSVSGQVRAALMTHREVDNASVLPKRLEQIPADEAIAIVGGDGAYDTKARYAAIRARHARPLIPPREGAVQWALNTPGAHARNTALAHIANSSRRDWKKSSGYHQRSRVENLMYRYKTLTGDRLAARNTDTQDAELAIRVDIVNRMRILARPLSVRIA